MKHRSKLIEKIAFGNYQSRVFDDSASFCEKIADQNHIIVVGALWANHKLTGPKEFLSWDRMERMNVVDDFCLKQIGLKATQELWSTAECIGNKRQRKLLCFI